MHVINEDQKILCNNILLKYKEHPIETSQMAFDWQRSNLLKVPNGSQKYTLCIQRGQNVTESEERQKDQLLKH